MQLKAAADYLHISPPHLASILAGKFPDLPRLRHVRVGRRILLRQDWLDQWMEEASLPPKS